MYKGDNAKLNTFMLNILHVSSLSLYFYLLSFMPAISYQLGIAKGLQFCGLGELKREKTKAQWVTSTSMKPGVS